MTRELPIRVDSAASVPIATQLAQQLGWLIASARISEGDDLPPIRQVADQLGINLHTVRAAYQQLSADGLVSMGRGRRTRVLRYDRARATASAINVPSFSFGVIIPSFVSFYEPLIRGVEAAASERPAMVYICNADEDPARAIAHLDRLVARQVDGVILAGPLMHPDLADSRQAQPPAVFIDAPGAAFGVEFDLEEAQYAATHHLIEHGHERIGYLSAPLDLVNVAPKLKGHERALVEGGIADDPELVSVVPDFLIPSGEAGAHHLLDLAQPPRAIAASSDSLALGAFHAITSRGLRVPEDIALVGNDDIEMASVIRPGLTTVSLPTEEAGRQAVALLEEMISGTQPERSQIVLETNLVIRSSCGCSHDDEVASS